MSRCFAIALVAVLVPAVPALAGPIEEADALNADGRKLYEARKYGEALAKFRAAWELSRQAKYAFNIASVLDDMGQYAGAADAYEDHLRHPDTAADSPTGKWARSRLDALEVKVARVRIHTGASNAVLRINGAKSDRGGVDPVLRFDPGSYHLAVDVDGRVVAEDLEVFAGETREVDFRDRLAIPDEVPVAKEVAVPTVAPPPAEPTVEERVEIDPWYRDWLGGTLAGVGVSALTAGGIAYLVSTSSLDRADRAQSLGQHEGAVDDAKSQRLLSQVLGGVGLVSTAAAVVRWSLIGNRRRVIRTDVTAVVSPDFAGALVSGRF